MTATVTASTTRTTSVAAPAATSSLRIADAHLHFFASKDDYLAFKAAWKALANSGGKLSAPLFAAHAILHGRDLYKTFSANRRPGQGDAPFRALAEALSVLPYQAQHLERQALTLTPEQKSALVAGVARAGQFMADQRMGSYPAYRALVTGTAQFAPLERPVAATVEA
jgi:hypothetical protein